MKEVTIYTTPTCGFCNLAKRYFKQSNVVYKEIDVSEDYAAAEEAVRKSGVNAVPIIEIGDEIIVGFDQRRLSALLGI